MPAGYAHLGIELAWRSCDRNGSRVVLAALAIDGEAPACGAVGEAPARPLPAALRAFWGERAEALLGQWCRELHAAPVPPPEQEQGAGYVERDEL